MKPYNDELTIIIPAKNEEEAIGTTLRTIQQQDYPLMSNTRILLADAHSTDKTVEIATSFPNVEIVPGGLPSVARNNGAKVAITKYLLFVDADVDFQDKGLIRKSVELARRKNLQCVTAKLKCKDGGFSDSLLYSLNNMVMFFSKYVTPFAIGAYMLFDREKFNELGGFDEAVHYAEDYHLSKKIKGRYYGLTNGYIITDNSRFKKMGYLKTARMFINTMLHSKSDDYFRKDHGYWKH